MLESSAEFQNSASDRTGSNGHSNQETQVNPRSSSKSDEVYYVKATPLSAKKSSRHQPGTNKGSAVDPAAGLPEDEVAVDVYPPHSMSAGPGGSGRQKNPENSPFAEGEEEASSMHQEGSSLHSPSGRSGPASRRSSSSRKGSGLHKSSSSSRGPSLQPGHSRRRSSRSSSRSSKSDRQKELVNPGFATRRRVLQWGGLAGLAGLFGGGAYARMVYLRGQLQATLVDRALPRLNQKADRELVNLPAQASQLFQDWYDQTSKPLSTFTALLQEPDMAARLESATLKETEAVVTLRKLFLEHVIGPYPIQEEVVSIANTIGMQLDNNWIGCCREITSVWQHHLGVYQPDQSIDNHHHLANETQPLIRESLDRALLGASNPDLMPIVGYTQEDGGRLQLGKSALLGMPILIEPDGRVPLFVVTALRPIFRWVYHQLQTPRQDTWRNIERRLPTISKLISASFAEEVRARITALHAYQQAAIGDLAHLRAQAAIGLIG